MKRGNRASRRPWSLRQKPLGIFTRARQKHKSYTFERLEERLAFTASPLELQTSSLSNDTPEGAAAILQRELQWALLQAASANGNAAYTTRAFPLPTDLYFPDPTDETPSGQWHLYNFGQLVSNPDFQQMYGVAGEDINVIGAWNLGYDGEGVLVAVIDDGVQLAHPDLFGNIHPFFRFNALDGTDNANPPSLLDPSHGTAVAGLIGATWSNEVINGIVTSGGGVGVAPGVMLVPITVLGAPATPGNDPTVDAFRYAMQVGVDVTNNSWGPPDNRTITELSQAELIMLRDSVMFGRGGLGMINVWAAGNGGLELDSASYDPFVSSRYTIAVGGVDHDGLYANADGTVTGYFESGASVLVVAPSGSNVAQNVVDDNGQGSGLWTTDLTGDYGYNVSPDPITGAEDDRDFLDDEDYTSRFNGTSASSPLATGVIALMLDANPNLTYRDVQEILVRSARQNAQFEFAQTGNSNDAPIDNTWRTNQIGPFRDPDPFIFSGLPSQSILFPLADPRLNNSPNFGLAGHIPSEGNDFGRQLGHYESQPALYTNGSGYTVSQGYGSNFEQLGYGHGVIDAELAVRLAEKWHTLNQDIAPQTEKTFTTSISGFPDLPAAEKTSVDGFNTFVIPGGLGGEPGFAAYWNEYFAATPPGPFTGTPPPVNTRGFSYVDYVVPFNQQINVEWVEVKMAISGSPTDLDHLRIFLVSPDGTHSEFNHYFGDPDLTPSSFQPSSAPYGIVDFGGAVMDADGAIVHTFTTNRSWGESTNTTVIIDPVTGEPVAGPGPLVFDPISGQFVQDPMPIFRDWELHIENYSNSPFDIDAIEIAWHGKPIAGGSLDANWLDEGYRVPVAQRVQGLIGITNDGNELFQFDRNVQTILPSAPGSAVTPAPTTVQDGDVERMLDFNDLDGNEAFDPAFETINQEPFAANILVEAYAFEVATGIVDSTPTARFLTGADGNYYFDLLPGDYVIRISDPDGGVLDRLIDDVTAGTTDFSLATHQPHFWDEWRITKDWFFAPDRDNPAVITDDPGDIFFGMNDNDGDGVMTVSPTAFTDFAGLAIPMAVRNINFLLKETPANNQVIIEGNVIADINENAAEDSFDGPVVNMRVYHDTSRNGQWEVTEPFVMTEADGSYQLIINATTATTFDIGVDLPDGWEPTLDGGDLHHVFTEVDTTVSNIDFFINPPDDPQGSGLGNIGGFVFNDINGDGDRDPGENGAGNITVFIDTDMDGVWDSDGDDMNEPGEEVAAKTTSAGGFFFSSLAAGTYQIAIHDSSGTVAVTAPTPDNFYIVNLAAGETRNGLVFGVDNLADLDRGDLVAGYGGASHVVIPHFRLGATIDGEIAAPPAGSDDPTDDGVRVIDGGGNDVPLHTGVNTLEVQLFGVGGALTGWIDWDDDGAFQADERLVFTDFATGTVLGDEADLMPGTYKLQVTANADMVAGMLAARFRWGEEGLDLTSPARIGEVEDYEFAATVPVIAPLAGDFNDDGGVNAADYVVFRKLLGKNIPVPNSTSPEGVVPEDEDLWATNYGSSDEGGGGGAGQSFTELPAEAPSDSAGSESSVAESSSPSEARSGATAPQTPVDVSPSEPIAPAAVAPRFAAFSVDSFTSHSIVASANDEQVDTFTNAAQSSDAQLLLLDQVWAAADDADDEDAPTGDRYGGDDNGSHELALAAVLEDESNWWAK